jgi:branched-chain amino acid transport system permease protein
MTNDYLIFTGLNILLAWSAYVILMSGSLSFANGAFMALGAYGSGVLTVKFGWPLLAAMPVAAVGTALVAVLLSLPALRTRGVYLILVTIGISLCLRAVLESTSYIGGVRGLSGLTGTELWHIAVLIVAVGLLLWWTSRSPLQRVLDAVREDESVARSLGINTVFVKAAMFGIGAAIAALAGALYAHHMVFVRPENFDILVSIYIVLYVILGGTNNLWGPMLGAAAMTLLPELLRVLSDWRPMLFGVLVVLMLLVRPQGLLSFRTRSVRAGKVPQAPQPSTVLAGDEAGAVR